MNKLPKSIVAIGLLAGLVIQSPVLAHSLREHAEMVSVADSRMSVTPARDWNKLSGNIGKNAEAWTLDGAQLDDVTFYGGIPAGKPLLKERNRKDNPLPKVGESMLLVEVPELLEGTYRTAKDIGDFEVTSLEPGKFLDRDGIHFSYRYVDADQLTRLGEARAVFVDGKLYMITFDAPRLYYFDRVASDFRALADTAQLQ